MRAVRRSQTLTAALPAGVASCPVPELRASGVGPVCSEGRALCPLPRELPGAEPLPAASFSSRRAQGAAALLALQLASCRPAAVQRGCSRLGGLQEPTCRSELAPALRGGAPCAKAAHRFVPGRGPTSPGRPDTLKGSLLTRGSRRQGESLGFQSGESLIFPLLKDVRRDAADFSFKHEGGLGTPQPSVPLFLRFRGRTPSGRPS